MIQYIWLNLRLTCIRLVNIYFFHVKSRSKFMPRYLPFFVCDSQQLISTDGKYFSAQCKCHTCCLDSLFSTSVGFYLCYRILEIYVQSVRNDNAAMSLTYIVTVGFLAIGRSAVLAQSLNGGQYIRDVNWNIYCPFSRGRVVCVKYDWNNWQWY